MKFQPLKETEVVRLWTTTIMKRRLPEANQANSLLGKLAEQDSTSALFENDEGAASWLKAHLETGTKRYLERARLKNLRFQISARFEIHEFGAYRSLGNQSGAILSGRYGVTLPDDLAPGPKRDDLHPGYISFYDPRSAMNMNAINRDPYLNYHRSIVLKPGLLLMWPSYLSFFIHPNLSHTPRVSVAFDIYKVGRHELG